MTLSTTAPRAHSRDLIREKERERVERANELHSELIRNEHMSKVERAKAIARKRRYRPTWGQPM